MYAAYSTAAIARAVLKSKPIIIDGEAAVILNRDLAAYLTELAAGPAPAAANDKLDLAAVAGILDRARAGVDRALYLVRRQAAIDNAAPAKSNKTVHLSPVPSPPASVGIDEKSTARV